MCVLDFYFPASSFILGILQSSGDIWKHGRRFTISHLKDFGFGTNRMEALIVEEVEAIVKYLGTKVNKPIEIEFIVNVAAVNVLWHLIAGM